MVQVRVSAQAARNILDVRNVALYSQNRIPKNEQDNLQVIFRERIQYTRNLPF